MSFMVLLCYFCDKHGPTVLLTTYRDQLVMFSNQINELSNLPEIKVTLTSTREVCDLCRSLSEDAPFITSSPVDELLESPPLSKLNFLSSRVPPGELSDIMFIIIS